MSADEGKKRKPIVCNVCRVSLKRDCISCCWQCKRLGYKRRDCSSELCGGKNYQENQYEQRDFHLAKILIENRNGHQVFFQHDPSGQTDQFFESGFYPEYLSELKPADAGPLLAFRASLSRLDSMAILCKVGILALFRLFSLAEQIVSGKGKNTPGGKSCSIILEREIWLYPLTLWIMSHNAVLEPRARSKSGEYRYQLKFTDKENWDVFVRTSSIGLLVNWEDPDVGAFSRIHVTDEHPVVFHYRRSRLHLSFSLITRNSTSAEISIRSDKDQTSAIIEHLKGYDKKN